MRLSISILFLCFYFSLCAQTTVENKLLDVEKQRFAAQVKKDYDVLDKLLFDDLVYIHSNGSTDTKASFIQALKEGTRSYDDIKIEQAKVRIYHRRTGIINGECTYYRTAEGKPNNLSLRYTAVYIRSHKQWRLVSWQSFKMN